jgi:Mce-associated membrane protein
MTDDPRPPRRPVGGSRTPVSRPRKVAGREASSPAEDTAAETAPDEDDSPADERSSVEEPEPVEDVDPGDVDEPDAAGGGRRRLVLVVAAVLLAALVAAEAWYLYGDSDPVPSAERPVVTGKVTHRSAVETAARSTTEILSYGFEDFDAQIEDATTKMTEPFADEFRQTAADVKDRFVEQRITQEIRIVASSVVSASDEEVRALLFLDQYVAKAGEGTSVTPYRALVTVRRSDGGWLVSDIETQ